MTGTEKQIEYANNLKEIFYESYQMEIDENMEYLPNPRAEKHINKLKSEIEYVREFDGNAGHFINRFKMIGRTPNYFAARDALQRFKVDEEIRNTREKEEKA